MLSLMLGAAAGCGPGVWSDGPPPPTVTTLCLLDVSGSMRRALWDAARDVCIHEIETAPPGEVIVRLLNSSSALNEAEIGRVAVPHVAGCHNPFAPRCKAAQDAQNAAVDSTRFAVIARVREEAPRPGERTDLIGALAAAALAFDAAPVDAERRLVVVSDLQENVPRDPGGIRLAGVQVLAVVQCSADPVADRRVQDRFRELVTAAGASDVTILALSPTRP